MLRKKLKLTCNMFPASNPENLPETVLRAGTEIYNYLGSNFKLQTSNYTLDNSRSRACAKIEP